MAGKSRYVPKKVIISGTQVKGRVFDLGVERPRIRIRRQEGFLVEVKNERPRSWGNKKRKVIRI